MQRNAVLAGVYLYSVYLNVYIYSESIDFIISHLFIILLRIKMYSQFTLIFYKLREVLTIHMSENNIYRKASLVLQTVNLDCLKCRGQLETALSVRFMAILSLQLGTAVDHFSLGTKSAVII